MLLYFSLAAMVELSKSQKSQEYLDLFEGDLDLAIACLRETAQERVHKPSPLVPRDTASVATAIDVSHITKDYALGHRQINAIQEVSLRVKQGEFIAITGASGSGKSTLLQLMGGLDKPSTGTILIDGQDISTLSDHELSHFRNRTIGFVFQFFYLQPFLKLRHNLEVPGMLARVSETELAQRAAELAEIVGLSKRLDHLPKELSGGQMQRAAIARALFNRPKILLADEPTGNLDSANSTAIISLFEKIRQDLGTTIVIVTHDRNIAHRADRIITLRDGVVL